jgi:hypothetical protein
LKWARTWLDANAPEGDTYVLLATDGAPSCNPDAVAATCRSALADNGDADTDPQPVSYPVQCLDDLCSFNAAYLLAASGYRMYVIGVGDEAAAFGPTMDAMAYYGGMDGSSTLPDDPYDIPAPGTHYFPADNAAAVSAALEDVTNSALSCVFTVDWDGVPSVDPVSGVPVAKNCSRVNVSGILSDMADTDTSDTDNRVLINYAVDCADEGNLPAWTWADLPGASWDDVVSVGADVSKCRKIRLCPEACDALMVHGGVKQWDDATARFGCNPVVIE